jgi:membrane protease YdiL (CAAX protease family)
MSTRSLILFCGLVLAISWAAQVAVIARYGGLDAPGALPLGTLIMFSPAIVTLGFAATSREARQRLRWKPGWRTLLYLVPAIVVPTAIAFAIIAIVTASGWGRSGWFTFSPGGVAISGGPWLLGRSAQGWGLFVLNVLVTGAGYALLNGLAAMGEEFGWRGFLQQPLTERFGITGGLSLLGLIWWAFHLPLLLAGYNYPQHPMLGAFVLFPATLVAASFFLGWLSLRSGSFWPAAVAHGAVNSIEEGVAANLHMTAPHLYEDLTRAALTVVVGAAFWVAMRGLPRRFAASAQTEPAT